MGILGWTPQVTWREAVLDDIALAAETYLAAHAVPAGAGVPDDGFMTEMIKKFPDNAGKDET